MSDTPQNSSGSRARGRGRSRGGLGKYLRARGRGRGAGRPAEFGKRLVLEDEEEVEIDAEEAKEFQQKYSRRQLGTNADRYAEPEPELNSDGEVEPDPEVDISAFLERQRLSPDHSSSDAEDDDGDIDTSLAHISSRPQHNVNSMKGKVQQIDWDARLDEMSREKAAAEAARDLKTRFREKSDRMRNVQGEGSTRERKSGRTYVDAPPLPEDPNTAEKKDPKADMQDFLDDLLS